MPDYANGWLVNTRSNRSYRLYAGDTRVGRGTHNDIVIADDPTVSRSHALFRLKDGFFFIIDQGATAPILLNDKRLDGPQRLEHDDTLVLGETVFRFVTMVP